MILGYIYDLFLKEKSPQSELKMHIQGPPSITSETH